MHFKDKAYYLLIGFFCFFIQHVIAQDQRVADSLEVIYQEDKLVGKEKLELLKNLAFNLRKDYDLSLKYVGELIRLAEQVNDYKYLYSGYLQKGGIYLQRGDLKLALDAFFESAKIATVKTHIEADEGVAYLSIADTYSSMDNYSNAEEYYNKAIYLIRKTNDSIALASALLNAGDTYFINKKYKKALDNFEESGVIFKKVNYLTGSAYNIGNVGLVYAE